MYTGQTGKFPHLLSCGNKYQIILHEIDGKSIWIEQIKNKTEGGVILARRCALDRMEEQGIVPTQQVLDKEISAAYRTEIKTTNMTFHIFPQDGHRCNLSEKATHKWKDHFIGVISGMAAAFSAHLWFQEIQQA